MTVLWWVRHGPTHQKTMCGWRDAPADLSDTAAIKRLEAYLPATAHVISSDLSRAVATADAIQSARERLPHDPDLREFDFGDWDGKHFSEIAETHPTLSRRYWENPGDVCAPGGESWNTAEARVSAARERLLTLGAEHIIVVSHFGAILSQVRAAAGITAYKALAQRIDNLSVTRIQAGSAPDVINYLP